ncbi:response regulator transcription factor [Aestuariicella hydrocarbonica]|uniref:Response regulator transcription factor n=1 Tax=Pseudomaricurvus hydrocarbonicus TaxID=1470433 RepID=A0A9E5MP23_9GAMM|nr:response regulator transcription factor [Aestuariicella hydrocarbonica]NHO67843.1 response regulator transcription factor [Aestuariicella hydrocarbonica]
MLKLLLIEDDLDLAQTLVQYLELEEMICDHASNGVAGLNLIAKNNYDVLLLDVNLPRMDGLRVCQNLRQKGNDVPVLMLTARDQLDDKLKGFAAGSDDYLVKPFELQELLVRIHALSRRRSGQVKVMTCGDLEMNLSERAVTRAGKLLQLSPTSWKLLECLLRASPTPVSRETLMDAVWGDEHPDSNSLKVHIFNLRKVIDAPFPVALLHTISGVGFALKPPSRHSLDEI